MLTAIFGSLASGLVSMIPGLASVIGNTIVAKANTEAAREAEQNKSGTEIALSWLQSVNELNKLKAEHQTERSLVFALCAFATPCALVFWAAMLDGIPWHLPWELRAHVVGSWGVSIPPKLEADYHMIVQSFFYAAPAIAGAAVLARVFRR